MKRDHELDLTKPLMWQPAYFRLEHVKRIHETIRLYNDGCLTTAELANNVFHQYSIGYTQGLEDANYPLPVTANVAATMMFADSGEYDLAAMWN